MSNSKRLFFFIVFIFMAIININSLIGCGELSQKFSWPWTIFGSALQATGLIGLCKILKKSSENNDDLIPNDYIRYGFFRSKWFYLIILISLGCMVFSYGVSHPNSRGNFKIGKKITSCSNGESPEFSKIQNMGN